MGKVVLWLSPELWIYAITLLLLLFVHVNWLAVRFIPYAVRGFFKEDLWQGLDECGYSPRHPLYFPSAVSYGLRVMVGEWINLWWYEGWYVSRLRGRSIAVVASLGVTLLVVARLVSEGLGMSRLAVGLVGGLVWTTASCAYFYRLIPHSLDGARRRTRG